MTILEKLAGEQVVSFELNETKTLMTVTEECDTWFNVDLSKTEVKQLIDELTALYATMREKA